MFIFLSDISLNGCIFEKMKTDFVVDDKWLPNVPPPKKMPDFYNAKHWFGMSLHSSKSNCISYKIHSQFADSSLKKKKQ